MKLSTKYILVILLSILIFPISFFGVNFTYYLLINILAVFSEQDFLSEDEVEQIWEEKISELEDQHSSQIIEILNEDSEVPEQIIYWINDDGKVLFTTEEEDAGKKWSATEIFDFSQNMNDDDFYNKIGYLEGEDENGYMFFRIPRDKLGTTQEILDQRYSSFWYIFLLAIWGLFVYITWLFFRKSSNRLVEIQAHMEENKNKLIPSKMIVGKKDEIGDLEESFNRMVDDLNESHEKEEKEKIIRKKLIASLSHDLRTPLAIISGHAHKLKELELGEDTEESLAVIKNKVDFLGELIDNLSSFAVLSEGRLPLDSKKRSVLPIIRASLVDWYPLFEDMGFEIQIDLAHSFEWDIDEIWFLRVLNNLFQNVERHAHQGKYISIKTGIELYEECDTEYIEIMDHGPGFEEMSENRGKGIGLSIVSMMLEQMGLKFRMTETDSGTKVKIYKNIMRIS